MNIPFITKETVPGTVELLNTTNQVVVYNLMDHQSVLAANLYKASSPLLNVALVDIRDPILPADRYVWLNVGGREQLATYYSKGIQPQQLAKIMDESAFINETDLLAKVSDLVVERNGGSLEDNNLLAKWKISSDIFHTNSKELERIVRYYEVLYSCHQAHSAGGDAAEELAVMAVEAGGAEVEAFYESQKRINKTLANKIRHVSYPSKTGDGQVFIQFTTLDAVAYTVIRRCLTAKRSFIHQSMGVYGQVVYSNVKFDRSVFDPGTGATLFLQGS